MSTVSICLCTINRYDLTTQCVGFAVNDARANGVDVELLCADNGSTDMRVCEYIRSLGPVYHRVNGFNAGYAPMLNQMLLRATGEYLCIIDNDILLPANWLPRLITANKVIPDSGSSGYHCVNELPPMQIINGQRVHPKVGPFGIKFFNRSVLEAVGYFSQDYGLYGFEDADFFIRTTQASFQNYYIADPIGAKHLGEDSGETTPYRKFKWEALRKSGPIFDNNVAKYNSGGSLYIAPPERA